MPRVISYFDKVDESYVDEIVLPEIPLVLLQKIFEEDDADDPMYDSYPIGKQRSVLLKKFLNFDFDFDRFDYFLEYYE